MKRAAAGLGAVAALAGCLEAPAMREAPGRADAATGGADAGEGEGDAGLLLRYDMEAVGPGGVVEDTAGEHDADCVVCPVVAQGAVGSSLDFDGGAYLAVRDDATLRTPEGTIAVWVWLDEAGDGALVGRPVPASFDNDVVLFVYAQRFTFLTHAAEPINDDVAAPVGQWAHVAASWSSQRNSLYVDGALVSVLVSPPEVVYRSEELLIGIDRDQGELAYSTDARLDDLRLYDRALTDDEVAALAAPTTTQ